MTDAKGGPNGTGKGDCDGRLSAAALVCSGAGVHRRRCAAAQVRWCAAAQVCICPYLRGTAVRKCRMQCEASDTGIHHPLRLGKRKSKEIFCRL
jgi:hypothetical protein